MAILRKNIWFIFYVLTATATLLFLSMLFVKWQTIYDKYQTSQENTVELMANATYSLFDTQERLMDVLGVTILEQKYYINDAQTIEKYAQALLNNPDVLAFGVTTPQGDFIYGSSHTDPTQIPSLRNRPESHESFNDALLQSRMIFGRTYFAPELQKWAMPIRKTIRDEKGQPLFVMTTMFKLTSTFDRLINTVRQRQNLMVAIIRESDLYQQYNSQGEEEYNLSYQTPFPKASIEQMYKTIFTTYNLSPSELKENEALVSFYYQDHTGRFLTSLKYNKTYKLWIIVHTSIDTIIKDFFQTIFLYFVVFIVLGGLFFVLFLLIARAEEKRRNDLLLQATYDQLTGLPNRSYLHHDIFNWMYKNAPAFSLFYIDIDHFKNINDSFGHQYGDYVLIEIAQRLKQMADEETPIIRYGGDEFVLITPLYERSAILSFATQLIDGLSSPYVVQEFSFNLGASIGIALYPDHGESLDMLLRASDIALYESKKIKNSAHIFASAMQEGFVKNVKMEQELRKAIALHELFMVYQPQVDAKGCVYGVEALLRWNSPTLGMVPPDHFIPLAETSGLMPKMGRFIVESICEEICAMHQALQHPFHVSINISVRQFMDASFLEHLLATIQRTGIDPSNITLEVTENLFIEDLQSILPLLNHLKSLGIHISMDDFGTGYSSLSMLRKLPIDELKIDKSFVDAMFEDEAAQTMVQNIIAIGKNFGMHIIAEGVETKEQHTLLHTFGCDRFQGYYFAKPLPKEDLVTFFQTHTFTCKD